jgi:hypothetical protein
LDCCSSFSLSLPSLSFSLHRPLTFLGLFSADEVLELLETLDVAVVLAEKLEPTDATEDDDTLNTSSDETTPPFSSRLSVLLWNRGILDPLGLRSIRHSGGILEPLGLRSFNDGELLG